MSAFQSGPDRAEMAARIDAALPQTQCTRCGYPDCRSYATAIAEGAAEINQCPPGGSEGVQRLAQITRRPVPPLNPEHGQESPRSVAWIDENWCIGCTLCLEVCPTDAILGANKRMHTVIEAHCTGCERCIPVCPVDCIHLDNVSGEATGWDAWSHEQAQQALQRYQGRRERLGLSAPSSCVQSSPQADPSPTEAEAGRLPTGLSAPADDGGAANARASRIAEVLERARQQRAPR